MGVGGPSPLFWGSKLPYPARLRPPSSVRLGGRTTLGVPPRPGSSQAGVISGWALLGIVPPRLHVSGHCACGLHPFPFAGIVLRRGVGGSSAFKARIVPNRCSSRALRMPGTYRLASNSAAAAAGLMVPPPRGRSTMLCRTRP